MVTDLTNTPAWVREIAEACESDHAQFFIGCGKSTVPMAGWYCPDCGGSATRRADIPRLIEAAAGMAEALELLVAIFYGDDGLLAKTTMHDGDCHDYGMARYAVAMALANWRGEVGE